MASPSRNDLIVMLGLSGALVAGGGVLWVKSAFVDPPAGPPPRIAPLRPQAAWPLDVNRASREDLVKVPGIGPVLAERIEAARPYRSIEELDRVRGIGRKTLDRLRRYLAVKESGG